MKNVTALFMIFTFTFLIACGGGSSSSGGGTPIGYYVGLATTTLTTPLDPSLRDQATGRIDVRVNSNLTVDSNIGGGLIRSGNFENNTLEFRHPGSELNAPGLSCSGTIIFTGSRTGVRLSGQVSTQSLTCNGLPFNLSGTWSASKDRARASNDGVLSEIVARTIRQSLHAE